MYVDVVSVILYDILLVCHDIDQWPNPEAGHTLQLPLMGNVMQVTFMLCLLSNICIHLM